LYVGCTLHAPCSGPSASAKPAQLSLQRSRTRSCCILAPAKSRDLNNGLYENSFSDFLIRPFFTHKGGKSGSKAVEKNRNQLFVQTVTVCTKTHQVDFGLSPTGSHPLDKSVRKEFLKTPHLSFRTDRKCFIFKCFIFKYGRSKVGPKSSTRQLGSLESIVGKFQGRAQKSSQGKQVQGSNVR
jgi:hypothetical protein